MSTKSLLHPTEYFSSTLLFSLGRCRMAGTRQNSCGVLRVPGIHRSTLAGFGIHSSCEGVPPSTPLESAHVHFLQRCDHGQA